MSDELVEAVARAMCRERHPCWSIVGEIFERDHDGQATEFRDYARAAIALIRPATLEEAAHPAFLRPLIEEQSAGEWDDKTIDRDVAMFSAAIRALKDKA